MNDAEVTLRHELAHCCRDGRSEPPRSYRQFLENDVVIPDGKYKGLRFRADRQPVVGLWIDAIDSGIFNEFVFTAPSQFGKTLIAFVGPLLYHTCERSENYVLGVPFEAMAADKWELDVKPVMTASPKLRRLLPTSGSGSAGGKIKDLVTLRNGVAIKLMSAGSQDTGKAGFTSRVLGVTEAARFSTAGDSSVEADPLRQLRARQRSFDEPERCTYIEGTVTVAEDLPWRIKPISTDSRIMCPCPHCEAWFSPERENLVGWQDAKSENEAGDSAWWGCPECGERISESDRKASVLAAQLVHTGQSVDKKGRIVGDPPDTRRLFFRATAYHNLFLSAGSIGRDEWRAAQIPEDSVERHSADRELSQFVHCVPYVEPLFAEDLELDKRQIQQRRLELPMHILPSDTKWLTAGVDVGEKKLWYLELATREDSRGNVYYHVPLYGDIDVPSDRMELSQALLTALRKLHSFLTTGLVIDGSSLRRLPDQIWYDAGFETDSVLAFVSEIEQDRGKFQPYVAAWGRGQTTLSRTNFSAPRKSGNIVRDLDPAGLWYAERVLRARTFSIIWDADTSKWQVQQAMTKRAFLEGHEGQTSGSLTLYSGTAKIHERAVQHWINERLETVKTTRGEKRGWVRHGANHLLDCLAMARRAVDRARHIATKTDYLPPTRAADSSAPAAVTVDGPAAAPQPKRRGWYENDD